MKRLLVAAALFGALFISGCASGPKFAEVGGTFPPPAPGNGRIFIYRASILGMAIQPDVWLNTDVVGSAKPSGFFYVDRPAGNYVVHCSTEVERKLSLTLDAGQVRYVRLNISMGFAVGHVYPELVDEAQAKDEMSGCHYTGGTHMAYLRAPSLGSAN